MAGRIELITGPMFSGKTTELMRRMKRWQCVGSICQLVKHSKDVRYSADLEIISHDQVKAPATCCVPRLSHVQLRPDCNVVGVDEGQFFDDLVEVCMKWASRGITVIVAGLDADYRRNPFQTIIHLVCKAEQVDKLNAICHRCKSESACFTQRLVQYEFIELVGGKEKYQSLCRFCYEQEEDAGDFSSAMLCEADPFRV